MPRNLYHRVMLTLLILTGAGDGHANFQGLDWVVFTNEKPSLDFTQVIENEASLDWKNPEGLETLSGHSSPPHWMRFRLPVRELIPPNGQDRNLLSLENPLLDFFHIYITDNQKNVLKEVEGGDLFPFNHREINHYQFLFSVQDLVNKVRAKGFGADENLWVYVYLKASSLPSLGLRLVNRQAFWESEIPRMLAYGFFYGFILLMAAYSLVLALHHDAKIYRSYVAYLGFFFLGVFSWKGFAYQWLWPDRPFLQEKATTILFCFTLAAAVKFVVDYAEAHFPLRWGRALVMNVYLLSAFSLAGLAVPNEILFVVVGYWAPATIVLNIILLLRFTSYKGARDFVMAWIFLAMGSMLTAAHLSGVGPDAWWMREGMLIGATLQFALLTFSISFQIGRTMKQKEHIKTSLTGMVPGQVVEKLVDNPEQLIRKPQTVDLSIMFIDIVSYSSACAYMTPAESFHQLKAYLDIISTEVTKHGGTVDRSLNDGLLCYFGYDLQGETADDHAKRAMHAAINIQARLVERWREDKERNRVFPLRIGIHSDEVILGNLGSTERLNYTIIGASVNLAKSYESACNPFKILVSTETLDLAGPGIVPGGWLREMRIKISNIEQLVPSWEINPFTEHAGVIKAAEKCFWEFIKKKITEPRLELEGEGFRLVTDEGEIRVLNVSPSGIGTISDLYMGRGVVLMASLDSADVKNHGIEDEISDEAFSIMVRWSRPSGNRFKHGFSILGTPAQKQRIYQQFCLMAGKQSQLPAS